MSQNAAPQRDLLFPHPFSKAYWKQAVSEFHDTKVMIFAALMVALRVIFKTISIPIGMDLRINTAFLINAFGAMVFGPMVAIAAAAVTDTLGCLLFPTGTYFFPFIFIEIAGSLIFALFLYRADLTPLRVILSRFCIDFFVNIVLNTPIMMLYYQMVMGRYYAPFDLLRIIKNLVLFPIESVILILFFSLTVPRLRHIGFVIGSSDALRLTKKTLLPLLSLFLAGCLAVALYCAYAYEHTSLSASYQSDERAQKNHAITQDVVSMHEDLQVLSVVAVVESAYPKLFSQEVTYTVAIYLADAQAVEQRGDTMETLYTYSKTPASKDGALTKLGTAVLVVDHGTDTVTQYTDDLSP